jgi:ABC-type branched-subunit amino acid transport system ATPase component
MSAFAIETQDLSRRFGGRTAVDGVSLQVPERSVFGFLGPNGAGKTTTIRMLLGLLRPTVGRALLCGIDVARDRLRAAAQVGCLLEAHGFYPNLSGRENLDLTRRLRRLDAGEIDRVLDLTDMRAHACERVGTYSLGMRQRLGLARAMMGGAAGAHSGRADQWPGSRRDRPDARFSVRTAGSFRCHRSGVQPSAQRGRADRDPRRHPAHWPAQRSGAP